MSTILFHGPSAKTRQDERVDAGRKRGRSRFRPQDRLRIRNTQNYAPDMPANSESSKKRTKFRSQQLWRERGVERAKWPRRPRSQSTGPVAKARRYWAFEGAADAAENFRIGANGGANEPEIQCSPFFCAVRTQIARCAAAEGNLPARTFPWGPHSSVFYLSMVQTRTGVLRPRRSCSPWSRS